MDNQQTNRKLSYQFAIICAMITTITASKQLTEFSDILKSENYYKQARHNLKLAEGAYASWIDHVFYFDKYSRTKNEDIRRIYDLCKQASEQLVNDVTLFRLNITNYLLSNDIVSANSISCAVIICSLLKLSCDFCDKHLATEELSESHRRTLDIIAPTQLFNNVRGIYKYLPIPHDLDINDSKNVKICMTDFAVKLSHLYDKYFTTH